MNDRTYRKRPDYLLTLSTVANDAGDRNEAAAAAEQALRLLPKSPNSTHSATQSYRLLSWELSRARNQ